MRSLSLLGLLALAACGSSAPYTIPAAVLNTGVALGVAGHERASGGCYAVCTHGTACNSKTGMCEPAHVSAGADEVCREEPGGGTRCIQIDIATNGPPGRAAGSGVGVSPATGSVPPPPNEASPRTP